MQVHWTWPGTWINQYILKSLTEPSEARLTRDVEDYPKGTVICVVADDVVAITAIKERNAK